MEGPLAQHPTSEPSSARSVSIRDWQLLPLILAAHFAVVLFYAASDPALGAQAIRGAVAAAALVLLSVAFLRKVAIDEARARRLFLVLLVTFAMTRLAWILAVRPVPRSDFAGYLAIAEMIAAGGPIFLPWPMGGVVAAWGYPLLLGCVLAIVPGAANVLVAQLLNVALGCAALFLLHRLVARIGGPVPALLAATLFLLWPAQLYLTSVLASEHLGVVVLLGAILCALPLLERAHQVGLGRAFATGLLLAACVAVRSPLISTAFAMLVALWRWRVTPARAGLLTAVVVAGLLIGGSVYRLTLESGLGAAPRNGIWWSLLTGTNIASGGSLSRRDQGMFFRGPTIEAADERARAEILRRVQSEPLALVRLAARKSIGLWIADDYAVSWGTRGLEPGSFEPSARVLSESAHVVHIALLALAALGFAALTRASPTPTTNLVALVLIFGTLLHMIVECQARYHFVFEPLLMAIGALGLARGRPSVSVRAEEPAGEPGAPEGAPLRTAARV